MNEREKRRNAVLYILFLVAGTVLFLTASIGLRVPVYETLDAKLTEHSDEIILKEKHEFRKDCPVFVYQSREETLERVEKYKVSGAKILPSEQSSFEGGSEVKVDVQIDEVSLLHLIFLKGGNSQS